MSDFSRELRSNNISGSENTSANIFQRELELLGSVPSTVFDGLCRRVEEIKENPMSAAGLQVLSSVALGAAIAVVSKNPKAFVQPLLGKNSDKFISVAGKWLPLAGTLMVAGDVGTRTLPVMWDTAINASHLEANKKQLGYNLGAMAIDYPLMGAAGAGGALAVDGALALRPGLQMSWKALQSNQPRLAYAAEIGGEILPKAATESLADSTVLFKKREWNLPKGERLELYDSGDAVLHQGGSVSNYKHKPVQNRLDLLYKPFDDIGQMLNSILIAHSGGLEPFYMVKEVLLGKSFGAILKHMPGKWEPEWSTNRCIELRSKNTGEIVNLKQDSGTPNCPLVIQPLEKMPLGGCTLERLPQFTRPLQNWSSDLEGYSRTVYNSQVRPIESQMKRVGFTLADTDPLNIGELQNGWKVALDPRRVYEKQYEDAWHDIDHESGVKLYSAAIHKLGPIYGPDSKIVARFKDRLGSHFEWLNRRDSAVRLFNEALQMHQKNGDLYDAYESAMNLFYLYRNWSNRGLNEDMLDKGLVYGDLAEKLLHQHHQSKQM